APGATIKSVGVVVRGDHLFEFRKNSTPIIARVKDGRTFLDLRTVQPEDDAIVVRALNSLKV
ncbi:MAG: L-seryl-tRNA(Sec) selenium transferase, partial [Actinomycetota bacterium]